MANTHSTSPFLSEGASSYQVKIITWENKGEILQLECKSIFSSFSEFSKIIPTTFPKKLYSDKQGGGDYMTGLVKYHFWS